MRDVTIDVVLQAICQDPSDCPADVARGAFCVQNAIDHDDRLCRIRWSIDNSSLRRRTSEVVEVDAAIRPIVGADEKADSDRTEARDCKLLEELIIDNDFH